MHHKINNILSTEEAGLLKNLEGVTLKRIFLDDIGEFALSIFLDSLEYKLVIKNIPIIQSDGDEYPKLAVEKSTVEMQTNREMIFNKIIKKLFIIRDEVVWKSKNIKWLINCDIGVKIVLEDRELVIVVTDSLAGLIKIIDSREVCSDKSKLFKEYWSMKTDVLESLKREEISL